MGKNPAFGLPNGGDGDGLAEDVADSAPLGFGGSIFNGFADTRNATSELKEAGELGDFGETGVAAEQLVATDAGEGDFGAGVAGEARDDKGVKAVDAWLVNFVEVIDEEGFARLVGEMKVVVMGAEVPGGLLGDVALIEAGIFD